jgi:ABC-type lipoprotein export system ATPase subunit
LLADEPTGDLDGQTAEAAFTLMSRLHREHQLTSVIATHNLSFTRRCHRVLQVAARSGRGDFARSCCRRGDVERDFIMNAQQAKEYGIINDIIYKARNEESLK